VLTIIGLATSSLLASSLPFPQILAIGGATALLWLLLRKWLLRYAQVMWACIVIGFNIISTTWRTQGRSKQAVDAEWEMCHRINARFVFDTVVAIGGFWVKLAQGASVASPVPEAYNTELSHLQDDMPADPLCVVEATLAKELGSDWKKMVRLHDGPPLGSGTIAQVHRATLRLKRRCSIGDCGGRDENTTDTEEIEGVVKVQHPNVESQLFIDIYASSILSKLLTYLFPHLLHDMDKICKEMATITKSELDFVAEATYQTKARDTLQAAGADVVVPEVYWDLVRHGVLAMAYIDGVKITELAGAPQEERTRLISTLIDYYGITLHGPIFNFDPHPGNLLLERETGRLVVLDWGQARSLEMPERIAFAKLFLATSLEDSHLFIEACQAIGFSLDAISPDTTPPTMIGVLRFLLRDSSPVAKSRADFSELDGIMGRLSGEMKAIQVGVTEIFKGALLPLSKTATMLREVASRLDVSVPLLHILTRHGYSLLLRELGYGSLHVRTSLGSMGPTLVLEDRDGMHNVVAQVSPFCSKLELALQEMQRAGDALGGQIAVLDLISGEALAEVSFGHASWLDPARVSAGTTFNILELSKLFLAVATLRLVDRGQITLDTVVSGKAGTAVTLEHVLAHTAGLLDYIPDHVRTFAEMCDVDKMAKQASGMTPLLPPGVRQQYHHTAFGWLLAHACQLAGTDVRTAWADLAEAALGHGRGAHLSITTPPGVVAGACRPMKMPTIQDFAIGLAEFDSMVTAVERGEQKNATAAERADAQVMVNLVKRPHWLEPSALSSKPARHAVMPGLQAFSTARGVADALWALATDKLLRPATLAEALRSRRPTPGPMSEPSRLERHFADAFQHAEWGLGVQLFAVGADGSLVPPGASGTKAPIWGHTSTNGSFALVLPGRRPLVAALLVNGSEGNRVAATVLKLLRSECGSD